jgi:DNA invertase Pin-like site-specific DNA recombinase
LLTCQRVKFERHLIRERTKAPLAAAGAPGWKGARPRSLDEKKSQQARTLHADHTNSIGDICPTLRISKATLHRYLGEGHAERQAGRKAKAGARHGLR